MSFEGFRVTATERHAINSAWKLLTHEHRDEDRMNKFMLQETRGYGVPSQRVPMIAAKGMCLQWLCDGYSKPDKPLRSCYYCRPAAIWFEGMGAAMGHAYGGKPEARFLEAVKAYQAAFDRMQHKDRVALHAALSA